MSSTLNDRFDKTIKSLWDKIGRFGSWTSDLEKRKYIHEKLQYFHATHSDDNEHITDIFMSLPSGYNLLKSALEWESPKIGKESLPYKLRETHIVRGIQWKLVIAHGGFETIAKTLMNDQNRGFHPSTIQQFIEKCDLPIYNSLKPPIGTHKLDLWLNKPVAENEHNAIITFLGLERGDATIIKNWIIESQEIDSWDKVVQLSKALRNATAHGALSATKVFDWDLVDKMEIITENLGEIAIAGLNKLIE
ncbi:hypothetical protein H6G54_06795 [Anabaena cylindrica FACHB-243]|uniref:Uncharacterized protein n=1 Tax=Anabaena cylindrica (strain ATCC 27899 / PCC 7122) TaxID=272123 RepID=K9ZCX1_ANACC|nr:MULTISPECIES: hypothetical protein [Anabaena]AFZ56190.1 hypothetical protein Anacy_0597 [Anabaena cylindrica PCC 7122]MBD2417418.1 hypothetical protein [Anabaena cylindrica FACHB-243]MBY5284426.1 hypothetical protein [Anabaena sp. CCAP 1446/1C]MBY5306261.1 hypothetical protein [Anabaena sp. CCAP 1446/1C]MCM2407587.1 hypothetical protein [Anabaena sp. CCAP 1446/1C]